MPKHPKRRTRRNLAVLALSALCLTGFLYWDNTALQVTRFDPVFSDLPAGFDGCRIVVLSDLHGASFGAHNADLLAAVAAEQPEYIFFLGDLEDKYRGPEDGYPAETARGLSAIAPTYYVTGNHEWAVGGVPALKEILTANGVTVLSNQFVPLERNGDTIVLAGIDDPNGYADQKTPEELAAWFREQGEPAFRARQVFQWLYRGAVSFDEMTDLPKVLRQKLEEHCFLTAPQVARKQVSAQDGTIKYLWRLSDGNCIETVLMRYKHGNTVCIS